LYSFVLISVPAINTVKALVASTSESERRLERDCCWESMEADVGTRESSEDADRNDRRLAKFRLSSRLMMDVSGYSWVGINEKKVDTCS
jgi:hypothetical protein